MVITRHIYQNTIHYFNMGFSLNDIAKFLHKAYEIPKTQGKRIAEYCIYCEQMKKGFCPIDVE